MERAREFGRSLLSMATSGSADDDREKGVSRRRSYSDVVSSSPPGPNSPPAKAKGEDRVGAGMPKPSSSISKKLGVGSSPGKDSARQKIFSVEDVAKLVEIARNQLRKEKEKSSEWKEVQSRDSRTKEKTYARQLVEGFHGSPEAEFKCWQCDQPGHKSSECPRGERCFTCNSKDHKRAECPVKRKMTRQEKGKGLDLGGDIPRSRQTTGIHIGESRPLPGKEPEVARKRQIVADNRREETTVAKKEWRQVPQVREKSSHRPGRLLEAWEAQSEVPRPGRHLDNLHGNEQISASHRTGKAIRKQRGESVFMIKSEAAIADRQALIATGGVVSRANGNPRIKDFIDALRKMSTTYETWDWRPIPINSGILFRFPSEGGLNVLTKRDVTMQ